MGKRKKRLTGNNTRKETAGIFRSFVWLDGLVGHEGRLKLRCGLDGAGLGFEVVQIGPKKRRRRKIKIKWEVWIVKQEIKLSEKLDIFTHFELLPTTPENARNILEKELFPVVLALAPPSMMESSGAGMKRKLPLMRIKKRSIDQSINQNINRRIIGHIHFPLDKNENIKNFCFFEKTNRKTKMNDGESKNNRRRKQWMNKSMNRQQQSILGSRKDFLTIVMLDKTGIHAIILRHRSPLAGIASVGVAGLRFPQSRPVVAANLKELANDHLLANVFPTQLPRRQLPRRTRVANKRGG